MSSAILTDERVIQFATWIIMGLLGVVSYLLLNWYNTDKKSQGEKINNVFNQILELRKSDDIRFAEYKQTQDKLYANLQCEFEKFNGYIQRYIEMKDAQESWIINKLERHEAIIGDLPDQLK